MAWNTATIANGPHDLTAVARDAAGNTTTSAAVRVTVNDTAAGGLVMGFGFEEVSGAAVTDSSGRGNVGTVSGAARVTGGRFGRALSFDGVDDWVTVADSASLDLTSGMTLEAWVRPDAPLEFVADVVDEGASGRVCVCVVCDGFGSGAEFVVE